jgi:protein TonB
MSAMPLRDFSRDQAPGRDRPQRAVAGLLTGGLYAGLAVLLAWWPLRHPPAPAQTAEITAIVLPDPPRARAIAPPPPFAAHRVKPRAEKAAPPAFAIASSVPPQAPAPLPATAAQSPLPGGTAGNGPMGQAASGNGSGGNGAATAGCIDAAWMRAVTERVRQFFYYPPAALAVRRTGLVMVHFTVRRDGRIEGLRISASSGDAGLDKAAMDIIRNAQPLPAITERMHADRVDGELPINFGVRNFSGGGTLGTC